MSTIGHCRLVIGDSPQALAAQAGFAPAPSRVTAGWTTIIPLSSGAAGRSCTCIGPFRRRMPGLFRRRQQLRMVSAAGLAPAVPWSQARDVAPTPRTEAPRWNQEGTGDLFCSRAGFSLLDRCPPPGSGGPDGICTHSLPADNGLLPWFELRVQMVGSAGNAPVVASGSLGDTRVTAGQPGHFPVDG